MAEVTNSGIITRTKEEIVDAFVSAWRSKPALKASFRREADTPQMQIAEPIAEALAQIEEALVIIPTRFSRSTAVFQALDDAGDRQNTERQLATRSTVTLTVTLAPGTTLLTGAQASDATDTDVIYRTIEDVTNAGGVTADFEVDAEAVDPGSAPFVAAGELTNIVTPAAGWSAVTNAEDTIQGRDREKDSVYRARQFDSHASAAAGNFDAMYTALVNVAGVSSVVITENRFQAPGVNGIPPKSYEVFVQGGADDAIAQTIWTKGPLGIRPYADPAYASSGTAIDVLGNPQVMAFSRPQESEVWVTYTLTTDGNYPGDAAFQSSVALAADEFFRLGESVIISKMSSLAFAVPGVVSVQSITLGLAAVGQSAGDLAINARNFATFDTSRITVL